MLRTIRLKHLRRAEDALGAPVDALVVASGPPSDADLARAHRYALLVVLAGIVCGAAVVVIDSLPTAAIGGIGLVGVQSSLAMLKATVTYLVVPDGSHISVVRCGFGSRRSDVVVCEQHREAVAIRQRSQRDSLTICGLKLELARTESDLLAQHLDGSELEVSIEASEPEGAPSHREIGPAGLIIGVAVFGLLLSALLLLM